MRIQERRVVVKRSEGIEFVESIGFVGFIEFIEFVEFIEFFEIATGCALATTSPVCRASLSMTVGGRRTSQ
jgi:hypothetical protein